MPAQHHLSTESVPAQHRIGIAPDQRTYSAVCRNKLTLKVCSGRCKMGVSAGDTQAMARPALSGDESLFPEISIAECERKHNSIANKLV